MIANDGRSRLLSKLIPKNRLNVAGAMNHFGGAAPKILE